MPVIPQTGLPGGGGVIPGAGKKASKLPGLKKIVIVAEFVALLINFYRTRGLYT